MDSKNLVVTPVKIEERKNLEIRAGDTIKVHQKIKEKGKFRLQVFEGLVLAVKHGKESGGTFTVRKTASGVGVERVFPIYSPMIDKIEITRRSKVRRSKLYHIRDKATKEVRRQMRNIRNIPDFSVADESKIEEKPEEVEVKEEVVTEEKPIEIETNEPEKTEDKKEVEQTPESTEKKEETK